MRKTVTIVLCRILIVAVGLMAFFTVVQSQLYAYDAENKQETYAYDWRNNYKSATGRSCCGRADCVIMSVVVIAFDFSDSEATVLVYGTELVLPRASVHLSEDSLTYWCWNTRERPLFPSEKNTGCVFYAFRS